MNKFFGAERHLGHNRDRVQAIPYQRAPCVRIGEIIKRLIDGIAGKNITNHYTFRILTWTVFDPSFLAGWLLVWGFCCWKFDIILSASWCLCILQYLGQLCRCTQSLVVYLILNLVFSGFRDLSMYELREYTRISREQRRKILLIDSVPKLNGDGEVRYYCPERNQQADIKWEEEATRQTYKVNVVHFKVHLQLYKAFKVRWLFLNSIREDFGFSLIVVYVPSFDRS